MSDKVQKIKEEIERQIQEGKFKCWQSQEDGDYESYVAWSEHIAACGKILSFVNTLPEEPASDDLEEAAEKYAYEEWPSIGIHNTVIELAFKAGAEWQRKKDQETIELAEDHAMLAGMNKMKEEMIKDTINGIMDCDDDNEWIEITDKLIVTPSRAGNKVKIIIVKEGQQ